jgi:CBS domain-containing protein
MSRPIKPLLALTASDLMSRDVVTIPEIASLQAAAGTLFEHGIGGAPVVDGEGRCIGLLCATDFMRWAKEGGSAEDVPLPACPYQVKGRLLTGQEAVICTLAEGDCPLQEMRAVTGGRHTAICHLKDSPVGRDWEKVTRNLPAHSVGRYMTGDVVTAGPQTPLTDLSRMMIDAHRHRVIVVEGQHKPIGIVSSTDILAAVAHATPERTGAPCDPSLVVAWMSASSANNGKAIFEQSIRLNAYKKWEAAGRPIGDGLNFWLEAERELLQAK